MITSLRLVGFKNFADETLRVGPFTVIVGANASGKSNIRDAFRVLHGIGRDYSLAEIIGGDSGPSGQAEWKPIRGAMNEIVRLGQTEFALKVGMKRPFRIYPKMGSPTEGSEDDNHGQIKDADYFIRISHDKTKGVFSIEEESLRIGSDYIYGNDVFEKRKLDRKHPALMQLTYSPHGFEHFIYVKEIEDELARIRFLDFVPDFIREPTFSSHTTLGDRGENLPAVLKEICADPKRGEILTKWVRELTPMDVAGFEFPEDPSGRIHLKLIERSGREISAYSASDGTLRFLALLAALLAENPARLYFFEEIDNGIHPARLHLLIDLIERQTAKDRVQVVSTTHSPDLLSMANDRTFGNMSVVCRLEDSEDGIIRPIANLPNAGNLRKAQGLGRLLSGGWMETALTFTEGDGGGEEDSG